MTPERTTAQEERVPQQLRDEVSDALIAVFGRRVNKGVAGDWEAVGRAAVLDDPSLMRFVADCSDAVLTVLDRWGVELQADSEETPDD